MASQVIVPMMAMATKTAQKDLSKYFTSLARLFPLLRAGGHSSPV